MYKAIHDVVAPACAVNQYKTNQTGRLGAFKPAQTTTLPQLTLVNS